jgi:putative transposase
MPIEVREVQQAYRFALDPTPRQERMLRSHVGAARFAYNWGNAMIIAALDARQAQKDAGEEPTARVPSHFDLCKAWTAYKDLHAADPPPPEGERPTSTAWVAENFVGTYQAALRDAAKAWSDFFKSAKGQRGGRRLGRPRFKKRGRCRDSFQVHGQTLRVIGADGPALDFRKGRASPGATRYMVVLPKIGPVFLAESARKLRRRVDAGKARIIRGTVSRDSAGRWHIALTAEVAREIRVGPSARQRAGGVTGIDLGVRDTMTLADGTAIENPAHLERHLRRLAAAQRAVSRRTRRGEPSSARRVKAVARTGRMHNRVASLRLDYLEKLSSRLVHSCAVIGVEGWDVQETAQRGSEDVPRRVRRNRNRLLLGSGLGMLRWKLEHKGGWYGCEVKVASAQSATGRTCSRCGQARTTPVPPGHELFTCPSCGWSGDRRLNTALVLAQFAREETGAGSDPEPQNARGGDVRPGTARKGGDGRLPSKREASSRRPRRGETGIPGG